MESKENIELELVFRRELDNLRQNNAGGFTDQETSALMAFIYTIVKKEFPKLLREIQELKFDIYNKVMSSNYNLMDTTFPIIPYVRKMIVNAVLEILRKRNTIRRKNDYNDSIEKLDEQIFETDEITELNKLKSTYPTPEQNYINDREVDFHKLLLEKSNKYPTLTQYYINGLNKLDIARLFGFKFDTIDKHIKRELAQLKMELAEEGFFDSINEDSGLSYSIKRIKQSIIKYGITATCIADEIPTESEPDEFLIEEVAKVINLDISQSNHLKIKIIEDRLKITDRLKSLGCFISSSKRAWNPLYVNLYLYLFKDKAKDFDKVSDDEIIYVNSYIKNNPCLNYYYFYNGISEGKRKTIWDKSGLTEQEKENIIIDEVLLLKSQLKIQLSKKSKQDNYKLEFINPKQHLLARVASYVKVDAHNRLGIYNLFQDINSGKTLVDMSEEEVRFICNKLLSNDYLKNYYINKTHSSVAKTFWKKQNLSGEEIKNLVGKEVLKLKFELKNNKADFECGLE